MDWSESAACRGMDTELFFPIGSSGSVAAAAQTDAAKAVCARCPVTGRCLARALDVGPVDGIWGGTTEAERRRLARAAVTAPAR